jgi:hypothetical protein
MPLKEAAMGARIDAFVEYGHEAGPETRSGAIDLTKFLEFRAIQNPDLLLALTGRFKDRIAPFDVPERHLPPDACLSVQHFLHDYEEDGEYVSWVYYDELVSRLAQVNKHGYELPLEIRIVLNMMAFIDENLGFRSCRLVYTVT